MAKLFIQDTTLTAIADAIRSKTGSGGSGEPIVVSVHTPNLLSREDTAVGYGNYSNVDLGGELVHEVITIAGAVKMHLDLKYQIDSMFAQIQISSGDVANTDTWNAGEYKYTKHTAIVETTLDIEGTDTVTINFYNQAMVENTSYWGYWIDVTGYDADGNQICESGANTTQYKPTEMPAAILSISGEGGSGITPSGELEIIENGSYDVTQYASALVNVASSGGEEIEPIVLTGDCQYACAGSLYAAVADLVDVSTENVSNAQYMFHKSSLSEISFDINVTNNINTMSNMFASSSITRPPYIRGEHQLQTGNYNYPLDLSGLFANCEVLAEIPDDYFHTFGGDAYWESTRNYSASRGQMFRECASLRKLPDLSPLVNAGGYTSVLYYLGFDNCYALDEIVDLPVHENSSLTSNSFNSTFGNNARLKKLTFATNDDGSAKTASGWKNQTITLTSVGCASYAFHITNFTSSHGIDANTKVTDLTSYEALKDNDDWWTTDKTFSRYNHDSAVETINSLPDVSASGSTNTIKFLGTMGSGYGKAISDLTEAEIAVATAKGWTISIT